MWLIDEHFGFQKNSAKSNRMTLNLVNIMARQYRRWRNRTIPDTFCKEQLLKRYRSAVSRWKRNSEPWTLNRRNSTGEILFDVSTSDHGYVFFLQRVRIRNGKRKTAHYTIVFGECKGVLCNTSGRFEAQKQHFCLLTTPHTWKRASSDTTEWDLTIFVNNYRNALQNTILVSKSFRKESLHNMYFIRKTL